MVSGDSDSGTTSESEEEEDEEEDESDGDGGQTQLAQTVASSLLKTVQYFLPSIRSAIPEPQWRILEKSTKKTSSKRKMKKKKKKKAQTLDLIKEYRRRVEAAAEFWGLSAVDRSDLERLIDLAKDPKIALPTSTDGSQVTVDPVTWGTPFLVESPAEIEDGNISSESESSSESDVEEKERVVDSPDLTAGNFVVCRPAADQQSEEQFWIAQVTPLPASIDHTKEIRVHWLGRRPDGGYELLWRVSDNRSKKGGATPRVPATDLILVASIQATVELTKKGGRLKKKSAEYISKYLLPRWARSDNSTSSSSSSRNSSSTNSSRSSSSSSKHRIM